jgi:hypothetical protein
LPCTHPTRPPNWRSLNSILTHSPDSSSTLTVVPGASVRRGTRVGSGRR